MKPKKREQILDIANKLFNRFGISKTGVDEIAKKSNVAKGTIYNYFRDKDGLIRELILEKINTFEKMINDTISTAKDPIKKLKLVLIEYLKLSINNPFLSDAMLQGNNEERIKSYKKEIDKKSRLIINKIVNGSYSELFSKEKRKIITDTLFFSLKGMDESIRNGLGQVSVKKFEREIDFLIKALVGQNRKTGEI